MTSFNARNKGIREVAKLAGVSTATVSRVANRSPHVLQSTQRRVRDAARSLGIELDRKDKPKVIAFLLSNREVLHPFHARILVGAEAACSMRGWDILFLMFRYHPNASWKDLHLPRLLQRRDMVTGLILAGSNSSNLLDCLLQRKTPFVVLGNNLISDGKESLFDSVFSDDIRGAYEMTRYLQSLRHRNIWFVGNTAYPWARRCLLGYERAMSEMNSTSHVSNIDSDDENLVGYLGTKLIFSRGEPVTAILGATDQTAQGIYKAAIELALNIPNDISVAGCNDTLGTVLHPSLSTIREFPELLGKTMVELLIRRIEKIDVAPEQVIIPIELVKRDSCQELALNGVKEGRVAVENHGS